MACFKKYCLNSFRQRQLSQSDCENKSTYENVAWMTKAWSFEEYIMSKDKKARVVVFAKEYI